MSDFSLLISVSLQEAVNGPQVQIDPAFLEQYVLKNNTLLLQMQIGLSHVRLKGCIDYSSIEHLIKESLE